MAGIDIKNDCIRMIAKPVFPRGDHDRKHFQFDATLRQGTDHWLTGEVMPQAFRLMVVHQLITTEEKSRRAKGIGRPTHGGIVEDP